jgi:hypothetical protein
MLEKNALKSDPGNERIKVNEILTSPKMILCRCLARLDTEELQMKLQTSLN